MEIEGLQLTQMIHVMYRSMLDLHLTPPVIGILCQILGVNGHLDDFTILLHPSEDVTINHTSIVDV